MDKKELIQRIEETIKELEESGDRTRAAMIYLGQVLKDLEDRKPYLVNPCKISAMMKTKESE